MSNHPYWRLYITEGFGSGSTAGYYCIGDIQMRATVGGADQCEGGTASASDQYSATYAASKAFDTTNQSTWWATFTGIATQWIKYAFASAVDVVELSITNRNQGTDFPPKTFKLQWSDNDSSWTDAGGSWSGLTWTRGETKLFTFPNVVTTPEYPLYRYWRLNIAQSAGVPTGKTYWNSFAEMQMRATIGGADQCTGGSCSAYSYISSSYQPAYAVDDSTSTYWAAQPASDPGVPYWIKYDFTNAVAVAEVAITACASFASFNYSPKNFSLQGSNDDATWTTTMSWSDASFTQGETKTFHKVVYAKAQAKLPYGVGVEIYRALPYSTLVAAAQTHLFDMPPLIVKNQVATPFGITLAAGQRRLFDMPPVLVSNQVAMPFGTLLAAGIKQAYACADLILQFTAPYDMTVRAAASLAQPFGMAVAKGVASPYALTVSASLANGYSCKVEKTLAQPYANPLALGGRQPYSITLATQNSQTFAILFATNSCEQPCPIQLEVYHVQPWTNPVAQANSQPLYDTVCAAGRQLWSILWPVAQANGQSFDRTITVATSQCQPHDLLAHNPVARALTGSWDLSANRPPLRLDGGVRAFHFGVPL